MRIRPNNFLRRVPPIRVTREMTRILDDFTEKSDLFKIIRIKPNISVKTHLAYKPRATRQMTRILDNFTEKSDLL